MKHSGTALPFLLSEVSSGGCLEQAMEEEVPAPSLLRNTQSCLETLLQVGKLRPREVSTSLGINPGVQPKAAATAFGSKGPAGQW